MLNNLYSILYKFFLVLFVFFLSCKSPVLVGVYKQENKNVSYELVLNTDSTFNYKKYTQLMNIESKGNWYFKERNIILNSIVIDTIGYSKNNIAVKKTHMEKVFSNDTLRHSKKTIYLKTPDIVKLKKQ